MSLLNVLAVLAFFGASDAKIVWPFSSENPSNGNGLFVNVSIGTPRQSVQTRLTQNSDNTNFSVPSTSHSGSAFDRYASFTFDQVGTIDEDDNLGVTGTDTFVIGGTQIDRVPLDVYDREGEYWDHEETFVSLAYPTEKGHSFIQSILKTQGQQTAVLSYDSVDYKGYDQITGTLTLGGQPDECDTNWTQVDAVPYVNKYINWAVNIDKMTIGRYQQRRVGVAGLVLTKGQFTVPESMFDTIERAVGAVNGFVSCDTKTKIVFNVGGIDLEVGPETYISGPYNGRCLVEIDEYSGKNVYALPVSVFKDLCVKFDYDLKKIGFAQRLK